MIQLLKLRRLFIQYILVKQVRLKNSPVVYETTHKDEPIGRVYLPNFPSQLMLFKRVTSWKPPAQETRRRNAPRGALEFIFTGVWVE